MTEALHFQTIAEVACGLEARTLSPVELVEALLERIESLNPQLDAFVTLTGRQAREAAQRAEAEIMAGHYRGSLHGIPVGLKDIYNVAGIPTTGHSRTAMDNVPETDSTATVRLTAAGGILMGKLSTHEFAHGGPSFDLPWPPARNPWNRVHFTGGSGSGSGAAVAAGFLFGAMGSDTGGSIRNPAALCGIVGLKPTVHSVSRAGVIPLSWTLDSIGPLTRTVKDAALVFDAISGPDPEDPITRNASIDPVAETIDLDISGMRLGLVGDPFTDGADQEVVDLVEEAAKTIQGLGARVEPFDFPEAREELDAEMDGQGTFYHSRRAQMKLLYRTTSRVLRLRSMSWMLSATASKKEERAGADEGSGSVLRSGRVERW